MNNAIFWAEESFTLKMEVAESSETPTNLYIPSLPPIPAQFVAHPVPIDSLIHHLRRQKGNV